MVPAIETVGIGRLATCLRETGLLLLLALSVTVAAWLIRPEKMALRAETAFYELELDAPLVAVADALVLYDTGSHLFLDTRAAGPGSFVTIPGALPVRVTTFDDDLYENRDFLYPEDPVVLFGDGNLPAVSDVAALLLERGFEEITIMGGDLEAWRRAGGPLTEHQAGEHE